MCTGRFCSPGAEQFSFFIVDDHIVLCFIREQNDTTLAVLHHFVTILHWSTTEIEHAPFGIEFISFVVMAENDVLLGIRGQPMRQQSGAGQCSRLLYELSSFHIRQ